MAITQRTNALARLAVLAVLVLSGWAAGAPAVGAQSGVTWRGEYYANVSLSGTPALVRNDASIDFNWGAAAPGSGLPADGFSARWTAYAPFAAGSYTFRLTADDGARLWVDEQLIIDQWRDQSATAYTVTRSMTAGYHSVRLEYYERAGDAVCQLSWSTTATPTGGRVLLERTLSGSPVLVRNDAAVGFDHGLASGAADGFRRAGAHRVPGMTGRPFRHGTTAARGVDGALVIDNGRPRRGRRNTSNTGANHQVVVVFRQTGSAVASCRAPAGRGAASRPPRIVDDRAKVRLGRQRGSGTGAAGHGRHLY